MQETIQGARITHRSKAVTVERSQVTTTKKNCSSRKVCAICGDAILVVTSFAQRTTSPEQAAKKATLLPMAMTNARFTQEVRLELIPSNARKG